MASVQTQTVSVHAMTSAADAEAFRTLNEEWIRKYFRLEEKDNRTLNDPQGEIVAKGGHVFIAQISGVRVGCVALLAYGHGDFELSKMAVAPDRRGAGIGRALLGHTLQRARELGATRVFLGSSSILANAVHLYETIGFRHVPPTELPHLGYTRADVYMTHDLSALVDEAPRMGNA